MRERLLVHLRSLPQIVEGWSRPDDSQPSQFAKSLTKVKCCGFNIHLDSNILSTLFYLKFWVKIGCIVLSLLTWFSLLFHLFLGSRLPSARLIANFAWGWCSDNFQVEYFIILYKSTSLCLVTTKFYLFLLIRIT